MAGLFRIAVIFAFLVSGTLVSAAENSAADRQAIRATIDGLIATGWKQAGVSPAPPSTDAEFLRRVYLDLTGRLPSVHAVRSFLSDSRSDKREQTIDALLQSPAHARHLAITWRGFLLPADVDVRRLGGGVQFESWLQQQFAENVAYDHSVNQLLMASGQLNQSGPLLFYTALKVKPEELAASTSRALMGVQIQCAQCHDHPFNHWSQKDFWGYAAFFARLQQPTNPQQFVNRVQDIDEGEVKLPTTDEVMVPTFLGGKTMEDSAELSRRQQLATWLTSRENPYFARAAVNRVWSLLFGRGIVHPVDDMGKHNPPSHPELIEALSQYFVTAGYDLRELIRALAGTQSYQLSSDITGDEPPAPELFASMAIKTLTADQLYDSLADATLRRSGQGQMNYGAAFLRYDAGRQAFLTKFRAPAADTTEYQGGIPMALTLMNGTLMSDSIDPAKSNLLASLQAPFFTDPQRVEILFLATLSRPPAESEGTKFVEYVTSKKTEVERRRALSDVLWALLNSAEFTLNH